jgi:hypothetical protein
MMKAKQADRKRDRRERKAKTKDRDEEEGGQTCWFRLEFKRVLVQQE